MKKNSVKTVYAKSAEIKSTMGYIAPARDEESKDLVFYIIDGGANAVVLRYIEAEKVDKTDWANLPEDGWKDGIASASGLAQLGISDEDMNSQKTLGIDDEHEVFAGTIHWQTYDKKTGPQSTPITCTDGKVRDINLTYWTD